jgi:hypothetical protein
VGAPLGRRGLSATAVRAQRVAADADRHKLEAGGRREVELRSSLAATEVAAAQERQRHEQHVLELETQLDLCTQDSERLVTRPGRLAAPALCAQCRDSSRRRPVALPACDFVCGASR